METIREWQWTSLDTLWNIEHQQLLFLNNDQNYCITDMILTRSPKSRMLSPEFNRLSDQAHIFYLNISRYIIWRCQKIAIFQQVQQVIRPGTYIHVTALRPGFTLTSPDILSGDAKRLHYFHFFPTFGFMTFKVLSNYMLSLGSFQHIPPSGRFCKLAN